MSNITGKILHKFFLKIFENVLDKVKKVCYNVRVLERAPAVLAQLDRVPGYEPVGRGFESLTPRQNKEGVQ